MSAMAPICPSCGQRCGLFLCPCCYLHTNLPVRCVICREEEHEEPCMLGAPLIAENTT